MPSTASTATRERAARDILVQIVARLFNLALGVIVTALVARTLGTTLYGEWSTIFVILGLVGYFASFGMEKVVIREVAANPESEHEWFGAMMFVRFSLLVPVILVSILAIVLLHRSHQMLVAGLILTATMPFDGVGVLQLVFQLRVDNRVPMLVLTLRSLLWAAAVAVIYWGGGGMVALAIAMAATNAVASLVQTLAALRKLERWPRPSRKRLRGLVSAGLPLGLAGVLIIAYARIDQLIVYQAAGSRDAGLYGAVYGMLDQAHFVPISILTTLTPIIAASWPLDRERMLRTVGFAGELMAIASLGGLAFAAAAAGPFVRLVFGADFAAAAPALPILGGAFVFICFGYVNGSLLTVLGQQGRLLRISLAALVLNVAGNLILVPPYGFLAAAWVTLATEILVFGLSLRVIWRRLELHRPDLRRAGRIVLAAALLGAALAGLRAVDAGLVVLLVSTCLLYPALLFGLRALRVEDLRGLLRRAPA
jgi:O-antigen/teichoic acid export membrane protein